MQSDEDHQHPAWQPQSALNDVPHVPKTSLSFIVPDEAQEEQSFAPGLAGVIMDNAASLTPKLDAKSKIEELLMVAESVHHQQEDQEAMRYTSRATREWPPQSPPPTPATDAKPKPDRGGRRRHVSPPPNFIGGRFCHNPNCRTTEARVWRFFPDDHTKEYPYCSPCKLYYDNNRRHRPKHLMNLPKKKMRLMYIPENERICTNCGVDHTCLWRFVNEKIYCNSCAQYQIKNGRPKPLANSKKHQPMAQQNNENEQKYAQYQQHQQQQEQLKTPSLIPPTPELFSRPSH